MVEQGNDESRERNVAALRDALDVYVSGRSGIRFDALIRFAGPLFDLYDVEWRAGGQNDAFARDKEELTTMVAVLDTARLLWAFYALDDEQSIEMLPCLEDAMLGSGAGDEERSNLLVLLSLLEEHWQTFTTDERTQAVDTPGYALPSFEMLLADYQGGRRLRRRSASTFGKEDLELPEALAAFAEPLLKDPAIEGNPDLVEERVERAQAYWELAATPVAEFDDHLHRIEEAFAASDEEKVAIREEALRMIARFRKLFPDHGGA